MTSRFFANTLFLILMAAATGCKSSQKADPSSSQHSTEQPQAKSSSTPSPIAKPATPVPTSTPPPIETMVPAKTYQLHLLPAAFSGDQVPNQKASEFQIEAQAGQFLRVKSSEGYRTFAQQVKQGAEPLRIGGLGCDDDYIYAMPQTGKYRILYAPWDGNSEIKFSWMDSSDPVIDPGIKREQFSVDLKPFAQKDQFTVQPIAGCDEEGSFAMPTHLGVDNKDFEFRIMSTAAYLKVRPQDKSLAVLEAVLENSSAKLTPDDFPYSRRNNWCGYTTTLRPERISGDGWHGVRWIGGFGGDEDYPSCGLGYVFNGISNDGRYLIVLMANLEHADLTRFMPPRKTAGPPGHTWETSDPTVETEMRQKLEKSLSASEPSAFTPNLNDLDAMIRSLKFKF